MQPVIRFASYAIIMIVVMVYAGGCVTMAKEAWADYNKPAEIEIVKQDIPVLTLIPVVTIKQPVIYREYIEPENLMMYRTGGRYLGESFGWVRYNVSGEKDLRVNVSIYDYKFMPYYQWWSVSWGQYFYQAPVKGEKYLFVFCYMVMEGDDQTWDPRMYGMGGDHFYVQYKNRIILPDTEHAIGLRIRQVEETFTRNDDARVYDYGYYRGYEGNFTETAFDLGYLRMGKSNAWDGYIIYSVPAEAQVKDLLVLGRFDGFGNAYWRLTKQPAAVGG